MTRAGEKPRSGYTTGSCAALAARAAARMLLTGGPETESCILTPAGTRLAVPLREVSIVCGENDGSVVRARCAVVKDAGDDPDVTNGLLVFAEAARSADSGVTIDGGVGIGRVTRPGLDQPVGAAAINSVPRRMIEAEVRAACAELGHDVDAPGGGITITVSIPGGGSVASRTFNPHLGVEGGLSVLGTTGIVEPMSTRAIVETVRLELRVLRETGAAGVILTPGRYGETFLRSTMTAAVPPRRLVLCSNFIGEALDAAAELGFADVLIVGHIGKIVKLAGGVMDTHSRVADCRLELLALHAALEGAPAPLLRRILGAATADDGLDSINEEGGEAMRDAVAASLLERAEMYCARRTAGRARAGVVAFSNRSGLLGRSPGARRIMTEWEGTAGTNE